MIVPNSSLTAYIFAKFSRAKMSCITRSKRISARGNFHMIKKHFWITSSFGLKEIFLSAMYVLRNLIAEGYLGWSDTSATPKAERDMISRNGLNRCNSSYKIWPWNPCSVTRTTTGTSRVHRPASTRSSSRTTRRTERIRWASSRRPRGSRGTDY